MSNLIDRQMAIDEWKNDFKGYINALNIPKDDYNGIMKYINELPSTQSYFNMVEKIDKAYDDGYKQGYLQAESDYKAHEIDCQYCDMNMSADDFCSRAERREEGGE